jgi:hypothetical protein
MTMHIRLEAVDDVFEIPNEPWDLVTTKGFWYHKLYGMPTGPTLMLPEGHEVIKVKETEKYVVYMARPSSGWCFTCDKAVWAHHTMPKKEYDRNFLNSLYIPD